MKTYDSVYTNAVIANPKNMGFAVRMYYDSESSSLRFAMQDERVATVDVHGLLTSVEFGESGFDPYTGSNKNASCRIVISDPYINSSFVATSLISGKGFINRKVLVYRYVSSFVDSGVATMFVNDPEFDGVVTEYYYDIANYSWVFQCESMHQHRKIPTTEVTKQSNPEAPDSSIGAFIPIVYGQFANSDTASRADAAHGLHHLAPTVCTDATSGKYVVASHAVSSLGNDNVAMYIEELGTYGYGLHAWDGTTKTYPSVTTSGQSYITIPIPSTGRIFRVEKIWLLPKLKGSYNQFATSSANAVDGDYNTDITIGASTRYATKFLPGILGDNGKFTVTASSGDLSAFAMFIAHSGSGISGGIYNPILNLAYSPSTLTGTGYKTWAIGSPTSGYRSDEEGTTLASTDTWTWDEISRYEYYLSVPGASSVDVSTFGIVANEIIVSGNMIADVFTRRVLKRKKFLGIPYVSSGTSTRTIYRYESEENIKDTGLSNVFVSVSGRKFGAWIGSRNGLASGGLISKSNYIIESILRDELQVDDAYIDETAFDNDYSDAYTMAFSLVKQIDTRSLIEDLANQSASYCYRKSNGMWTVLRIPATPTTSVVDFDYENGDVDIRAMYLSPHEWIENEVIVKYNFDYATSSFTRDITAEDSTSKGSTANAVKAESVKVLGADFLRHDSNSGSTNFASSLRDYRLGMWAYPHNMVEFDCLNPAYFNLEEGDTVTFQNVDKNLGGIGAGSAGDYWASFADFRTEFWLIYARVPYLDKVSYKAIQLHDFS